MSITRINHFEAKPGHESDLFEFMNTVVAQIRNVNGCVSCSLLKGAENDAHLAVIEEWESIDHHQAAANVIPKEQIEKAMTYFAKPPSGIYYVNA